MATVDAAAFWSYSNEDDRLDSGRITLLARRLENEFSLLTGHALELFLDRQSIQWGDRWRKAIDSALEETIFFIPVITPRYFTRTECRKELLSFSGKAASLGAQELLLPVLYAPVPSLREDSDDEAVALVASTQYIDWTQHRLTGSDSPDYAIAVNAMAKRIAEAAEIVSGRLLKREDESLSQPSNVGGFEDAMGKIDELLPDWIETLLADQVTEAQHTGTMKTHLERLRKLERSRAPAGAKFAVISRIAEDDLPIARQHLEHAKRYLANGVQLDPFVTAAVNIADRHPECRPRLSVLRSGVDEALGVLARSSRRADEQRMAEYARGKAHISRKMLELAETYEEADRYALDANAILARWAASLEDLVILDEESAPPLRERER